MSLPTDTIPGPGGTHPGAARDWFVRFATGATEGPISESELRSRAATGLLSAADLVSPDRAGWVPAGSVPWLRFPPPTPAQIRPLVETVVAGALPAPVAPSGQFAPLDSVPGYEITGLLGTGACGVVFRAVQTRLDRVVALKTVRVAETAPADVLARFDQEAVALARLQHPNIVTVHDCGHTQGRAFFAMELLDGEDLGQKLQREGPLGERLVWLIARQTAAALDHADRHGVIHRDVKPANLFLVPPPTGFPLPSGVPMVKVTDFGLALTLRGPEEADLARTSDGVFLGTPVYMAPEQFGGPVDRRADIYSLGATVYQALTGALPFDGRTVPEVMRQKALPAPRLPGRISEETADLVAAMMAPEAGDRPGNYAELIARIDALPCLDGAFTAAGLPIAAAPPPLPSLSPPVAFGLDAEPLALPAPEAAFELPPAPGRRRRRRYAVAAAVLVGVLSASAVVFNRPSKPPVYAVGATELLFAGTPLGWNGSGWHTEKDDEGVTVLAGQGQATRPLHPWPHFRVTIRIDLHRAGTAELVIASTAARSQGGVQWVVRLDRAEGASFGKRSGPAGAFEPVRAPVPLPTARGVRTPYLQVRYEYAGGVLAVWLDDQPLGYVSARGLRITELLLDAQGGPVRIDGAEQAELIEKKAPQR
ncbi:MAG TPA: protein kinase [Gemmata sp.]